MGNLNIKILPLSLQWYGSESRGDEWLLHTTPAWAIEIRSQEGLSKSDLRKWAEDQVLIDIKRGYFKVKNVDFNKITFAFDVKKWLDINFLRSPEVHFELPRTLVWRWYKRVPDTVLSHSSWIGVAHFMEEKFKDFLKKHHKNIFKDKMKILGKVNYNWFEYETDMQYNKFVIKLKYSVMIAMAIGAKMAKRAIFNRGM